MKENRPDIYSERGELTKFGFLGIMLVVVALVIVAVNALNIKGDLDNLSVTLKTVINQSKIYDSDKIIRDRIVKELRDNKLEFNASEVHIVRRNNMINLKFDYETEIKIPLLPITPTFTYIVEENTSTAATIE